MKLQLHIGTHKTGTTAIQSYLYEHRKDLKKSGVLYPKCCNDVNEKQFSFIARHLRNNELNEAKAYIEKIKHEATDSHAHLVVVSGEDFSLLKQDQIEALADMLQGFDVEVVIYFRNIYDHLISTFAQINRLCKVLPAWVNMGQVLHDLMDYDAILTKWCSVFGGAKIRANSYDQHKANLIEHFIDHLNIPKNERSELLKSVDEPRFTNNNAKFDPIFEFFLMLTGYSNASKDFDRARHAYKKTFGDKAFTRDTQLLMAQAFLRSRKLKFNHPKLKAFKQDLRPELAVQQNVSNTDVGEFMIALGGVMTQLGRAKVRDDYRIVKIWRRWFAKAKFIIKSVILRKK